MCPNSLPVRALSQIPRNASRKPTLLRDGPTPVLRLHRNSAPSLADGHTRGRIAEEGNCTFGGSLGNGAFKRLTEEGSQGTALPSMSLGEVGNASAVPLDFTARMSSVSHRTCEFFIISRPSVVLPQPPSAKKSNPSSPMLIPSACIRWRWIPSSRRPIRVMSKL